MPTVNTLAQAATFGLLNNDETTPILKFTDPRKNEYAGYSFLQTDRSFADVTVCSSVTAPVQALPILSAAFERQNPLDYDLCLDLAPDLGSLEAIQILENDMKKHLLGADLVPKPKTAAKKQKLDMTIREIAPLLRMQQDKVTPGTQITVRITDKGSARRFVIAGTKTDANGVQTIDPFTLRHISWEEGIKHLKANRGMRVIAALNFYGGYLNREGRFTASIFVNQMMIIPSTAAVPQEVTPKPSAIELLCAEALLEQEERDLTLDEALDLFTSTN